MRKPKKPGLFQLRCPEDFKPSCVAACPLCHVLAREHCCSAAGCGDGPLGNATVPGSGDSSGNSSGGLAVRWLHIPKCGSTLGISLLAYACAPELPPWHIAYMAIARTKVSLCNIPPRALPGRPSSTHGRRAAHAACARRLR